MVYFLSSIWFIRQIKATLFWLYLWQLKNYHIGRFVDHFRTEKGKSLFFNNIIFLKSLALLASFFLPQFAIIIIVSLYLIEAGWALKRFFQKKIKKPIFTSKVIFLSTISFVFEIIYPLLIIKEKLFVTYLLFFDILTPLIIAGIVLVFQPLTVLLKNRIIQKARKKRKKFKKLLVIGITGSYGKTSTKEFLFNVLSKKFKTLKTKEHQNSEMGIARCVINDLNEEYEIFIVEMGAYNKGGIKLLCEMVNPKIGILTGINEQHLATFGSLKNIIKAKYELIESLPSDGTAIFNGNNENCRQLYKKTNIPKLSCGTFSVKEDLQNNLWAENIKIEEEKISFNVLSKEGDSAFFELKLFGAQNVENILLAVSCAKKLGMSLKEISEAFRQEKQPQAIKVLRKSDSFSVLESTYSTNPNGVLSHLEYLKAWTGKKIIVMPCLIELAQSSKENHRKIGQKIGESCDLCIITAKECFPVIKKAATEKGIEMGNVLFIRNPLKIAEKIKSFANSKDVVLLEGRLPAEIIKLLGF